MPQELILDQQPFRFYSAFGSISITYCGRRSPTSLPSPADLVSCARIAATVSKTKGEAPMFQPKTAKIALFVLLVIGLVVAVARFVM